MMSGGSRPEGPTVSRRSRHAREDASGAEETRTLRMVSTHPLLRAAEKAQPYPMNECMADPDPDSRASRPVRVAPGVAPRPLAMGALSPGSWRGMFGAYRWQCSVLAVSGSAGVSSSTSNLTKALSRPRRRAFESSPSSSPSQTGVAHSRWGAARSPPGWTRGGPRVPSSGSYPARPSRRPTRTRNARCRRRASRRRATGTRAAGAGSPARTPRRLGSTRAGDDVIARARDRGDPRAALVAVAPRSPRGADALVRIARSINGWERLADATLRRASGDDDEARSRRARRTSSAIASLVARAYEHRVGERARSRPPARPRSRLDDGAVARVSPRRRRVLAS